MEGTSRHKPCTEDMVALMGPSGAGKTTLLNSIVGRSIEGLVEGAIFYDGQSLGKVRSSVGYVTSPGAKRGGGKAMQVWRKLQKVARRNKTELTEPAYEGIDRSCLHGASAREATRETTKEDMTQVTTYHPHDMT